MTVISKHKEKGFLGPGIYHQCSTLTDIKDVFSLLNINDVIFTHGAKLTEDEDDEYGVGSVATNRAYDDAFTAFDRPMNGEEIAGAFGVMLVLEQNPNMLNELYSATSVKRYTDFTQTEPVTLLFELFLHRNDVECSIYFQRLLKPRPDK